VENSKVQVDYLIDMNLVGKRVKRASDRDIYWLNHVKVIAERCRVYEG
jgi:hypothetical protein